MKIKLVIAEMDQFCFFTVKPDSSPITAEKVTQWFGGDSGRTIPFSPTIGTPAYLNGYEVIPLVAGLIEKRNGTGNRDGFHGNRRSDF